MNEWLKVLIALSVGGSGVLLLSILITYVTKGSLSAKWSYLSLKLTLFFFLVPVFMIPELLSNFRKVNTDIYYGSQSVHQNTLSLSLTFVQILFAIWVVGVFITSVWSFYSYKSFIKKMKIASFLVPEESKVQHLLNKNMVRMNISAEIKLVYSHCNISPFLIGILKTFIVLPMYKIPNDELDLIIKHELTHFKKKDLWVNRAMLIATILHWYNPLVYLLQKEMHVWCELSCDEEVVMKMSHIERKKYGETILNMIERANEQSKSHFVGAFFSTKQMNLKRRLIKMLKVKKMSKSVIALYSVALLTLGSIGVLGSTLAKENTPSVSKEVDQEKNKIATLVSEKENKTESPGGYSEISAVKLSDKSKFSEESWKEVLKGIEAGEIILEDE